MNFVARVPHRTITRLKSGVAALVLAGLMSFSAALAVAHDTVARTETVPGGHYTVRIGLAQDPPTVESLLEVTAVAAQGTPSLEGATLTLTGKPGLGTDAVATRSVTMTPDPQEKGSFEGKVGLPVRGNWFLQLDIAGTAGNGTVTLPVLVAAPTAIPPWLGWLIAMAPLLGVVWFGWWNRAYYLRLRREAGAR